MIRTMVVGPVEAVEVQDRPAVDELVLVETAGKVAELLLDRRRSVVLRTRSVP